MNAFRSLLARIESLSERSGKTASWLVLALTASVAYEVFMRYALDAPTIWSFDVSYMLGGSVYVLGLAYVLRNKENVRVDIITAHFRPKLKLIIDLLFTLVFFFPVVLAILVVSVRTTVHSWAIRELASYTIWYPPIYPLRTVVSVALLLLLLQGLATFARDLLMLIERKES